MATRRTGGLDDDAIQALRVRLAEGKKPRVQFSGPQFPDGTTGSVVRIGDPAVDGSDFMTVRVTLNGTADELAFAPNELTLPGSARAKASTTRARPTKARPSSASASRASASKASASKGSALKTAPANATPVKAPPRKSAPRKPAGATTSPATLSPATPSPVTTSPATTSPATATASAANRVAATRPKRKTAPIPTITITIRSSGASWAATATRGAKSVAKAFPIVPGAVTAIAALLDQPAVSDAVAEVNETALAEAQDRAAKLRAELAELDALVAAHRSPR